MCCEYYSDVCYIGVCCALVYVCDQLELSTEIPAVRKQQCFPSATRRSERQHVIYMFIQTWYVFL